MLRRLVVAMVMLGKYPNYSDKASLVNMVNAYGDILHMLAVAPRRTRHGSIGRAQSQDNPRISKLPEQFQPQATSLWAKYEQEKASLDKLIKANTHWRSASIG